MLQSMDRASREGRLHRRCKGFAQYARHQAKPGRTRGPDVMSHGGRERVPDRGTCLARRDRPTAREEANDSWTRCSGDADGIAGNGWRDEAALPGAVV